jgi:hypothetical protein
MSSLYEVGVRWAVSTQCTTSKYSREHVGERMQHLTSPLSVAMTHPRSDMRMHDLFDF